VVPEASEFESSVAPAIGPSKATTEGLEDEAVCEDEDEHHPYMTTPSSWVSTLHRNAMESISPGPTIQPFLSGPRSAPAAAAAPAGIEPES